MIAALQRLLGTNRFTSQIGSVVDAADQTLVNNSGIQCSRTGAGEYPVQHALVGVVFQYDLFVNRTRIYDKNR